MIVRIQGEGQFRLDDDAQTEIDQLDDALAAAVEAGQTEQAHDILVRAITLVHTRGSILSADDLSPSEIILPPIDATLEETRELLKVHPG